MSEPELFLIVDVEATCDDSGQVPRIEMETIEIGAVLVDGRLHQPIDEFQGFVRPVRHPALTEFCRCLTSISQDDVNRVAEFPHVIAEFEHWMRGHQGELTFCSWGDYDRKQLAQDCEFHGIANPLPKRHLNLKTQFSETQGLKKKLGLGQALRHLGLELIGNHHRGIDDARNIARLLPFALGAPEHTPCLRFSDSDE